MKGKSPTPEQKIRISEEADGGKSIVKVSKEQNNSTLHRGPELLAAIIGGSNERQSCATLENRGEILGDLPTLSPAQISRCLTWAKRLRLIWHSSLSHIPVR